MYIQYNFEEDVSVEAQSYVSQVPVILLKNAKGSPLVKS